MSELLKKYESIDQSKLSEATIKILNRVKTITADFTADDAKNNDIAEKVMNEILKKNPDAVKIVKREPKAKPAPKKTHKAKGTHKAKATHKATPAPATKTANNNIMSVAKEIQKTGESWKDAMERAKQVLKERKEQNVQKSRTEMEKLLALVRTRKELQGFANSDIKRDSVRTSKVKGSRVVTREGFTSNQYKQNVPNKLGRKYWESRENRSDRLAPNYQKDMPLLAGGGAVNDAPFEVFVFKSKLRFDNELPSSSKGDFPTFAKAKEFAIDMIDSGNYYATIMNKRGNLWGVSSNGVESFANGGSFAPNVSDGTAFMDNAYFAKGGRVLGKKGDITFTRGRGRGIVKDVYFKDSTIPAHYISYETDINEVADGLKRWCKIHNFDFDNIERVHFAKGGSVDIVNGAIKVGVFSTEDLETGVFEKALDKKSKETGLTNIDLKVIKKGGKTLVELYLIPNEEAQKKFKIKKWYTKTYPTDDLGEELDEDATFEDVWTAVNNGTNVYSVFGVGDSLVRERIFDELSKIYGVDYEFIYKKWLKSDDYANGGNVDDSWELKNIDSDEEGSYGKVVHNGKEVADYEFDRYARTFWVENPKGGQMGIDTPEELFAFYKAKGFANGGKLTKSEVMRNMYKPSGDYFFEQKGDDLIVHLTSRDAGNSIESLMDKYDVKDNGKGYHGSSYILSRKNKFNDGGGLEFMTDPNFGDFQNTEMFADGGSLITETVSAIFNPNQKSGRIETGFGSKTKEGLFAMMTNVNYSPEEITTAVFVPNAKKGRIYTEFGAKTKEGLHEMITNIRNSFELGGAFMMTDLAGHTGGSDGLGNPMPLSGVSGTHYTGLVGETGAMSSGEMFMDGGDMMVNQQVINDASQPYVITEAFGNPAQQLGILAKGGSIENQYEGRTSEDVWNNLSVKQRKHFLIDHFVKVEDEEQVEYDDLEEEQKEFVDEYSKYTWKNLDWVKIPFKKHVKMGQYAYGGRTKSTQSMRNLYIEQIANMTNTRAVGVNAFANEHSLTDSELSNLMTGLGRGMVTRADFVTALSGEKNNTTQKEVVAFAKSDKAYKMADGGSFAPNVADGTQFMNGVYADGGDIKKLENSLINAEETYRKAIRSEQVGIISPEELVRKKIKYENIKAKVNQWYASRPIGKKMANGGSFAPNVADGTAFMDNAYFADGGTINGMLNKKIQKLAEKKGLTMDALGLDEYNKAMTQALVESLTDANFHDEAKQVVVKAEGKTKWSDDLYQAESFNPDTEVASFAREVARTCEWDGDDILNAYYFITKMQGSKVAGMIDDLFLNPKPTKSSSKPTKYIDHDDIESVTLNVNGNFVTFAGKDFLNGANLMEKGGDLSKIATYFPKRDIVKVTLKNGDTIKPLNGYWLKKGSEPMGKKNTGTPSKTGKVTSPNYPDVNFNHKVVINGRTIHLALAKSYKTGLDDSKQYDFIDVDGNPMTGYGYSVKEALKQIEEYGNDPIYSSKNTPPKIDETKAHFKMDIASGGKFEVFVDSNFVNQSQNNLPNTELKHYGFGDFYLQTPDGNIDFIRTSEEKQGFVGRTHKMKGSDELVLKLVDAMKEKGRFESTQTFANGGSFAPNVADGTQFMNGVYANGGGVLRKLENGVYRVGKPTKVSANLYEQKIVEIFDNGDISTASDYGRKLSDFKSQKYPIITKEQLEAQYKMANGGMTGSDYKNSLEYKALRDKFDKLHFDVKSKVVIAVGLDSAIEFYDADLTIAPYRFIERAVTGNFISLNEINQRLIDSAMEEAEEIDNDEDLEEIGSSDFTYYLKNVLDGAGFKVGFVGSRLERLNEDGSIKQINNGFFEDGGFMNNVYADGGEVRRFNRHEQMDSETREEVLDVVSEPQLKGSLTNYLYGLYDGYDYSETENFKKEMSKLKSKDLAMYDRINAIYRKIDKYKFEQYDDFANGGMFDDNDGFMRADNERSFRYPEREVRVDSLNESVDLTSNVSYQPSEVVIRTLDENIDLNDDNRIRARMGSNPMNRNPNKMMAVNPRMIVTDLPKPTSSTHKND